MLMIDDGVACGFNSTNKTKEERERGGERRKNGMASP
jgi:hypothetical protein